jgi:hypothetical protein
VGSYLLGIWEGEEIQRKRDIARFIANSFLYHMQNVQPATDRIRKVRILVHQHTGIGQLKGGWHEIVHLFPYSTTGKE